MARYAAPGKSELVWVTTMASKDTPTAAEINAGTDITAEVQDLPDIPRTTNLVDVADLSSKFEKRQVGTRGGDLVTLNVFRDDGATEPGFDALTEDAAGFLVRCPAGPATPGTFAASDVVDVYPATVASSADPAPGRNAPVMAAITFAITDTPNRNYTLAS